MNAIKTPSFLQNSPDYNFLNKVNQAEQNDIFDFFDLGNIDSPYNQEKFSCKYLNESDISTSDDLSDNNFLLSFNIQCLSTKFSNFKELVFDFKKKPVVILLQEVWHIENSKYFEIPGYHEPVFRTREGRGGGVGIFVRNDVNFEICVSPFHERIFESQLIKLKFSNDKNLYICNIYRPNTVPSHLTFIEHFELFLEYFNNLMDYLNEGRIKTIIGGDFNLNILNFSDNSSINNYINSTFSAGFIQTIIHPTRVQNNSATCIDHFLTNLDRTLFVTKIIVSSISDHYPIIFLLDKVGINPVKTKSFITRDFSDENIENFINFMSPFSWASVLNENDCDVAFNIFLENFITFYNSYFPPLVKKFNKNIHKVEKWMTRGLLISRQNKLKLQKLHLNFPSPENTANFKNFRKIYNHLLREAKKLYYHQQIDSNIGDPKKTWNILNETIKKTKKSSCISSILTTDGPTDDPQTIANEFNNFYSSIATKIANQINPTGQISPSEEPVPELNEGKKFNMSKIPLQQAEVIYALNSLISKHSKDPDDLSMYFIKKIFPVIEVPLMYIFRKSIATGKVPEKLKIAKISPIFKSGDNLNVTNYRPISLLSNFAKILEKIVHKKLSFFLESNNLLSKYQFGFRRGHSTTHPTTLLMNFLAEAFNKKHHAAAIFCDLAKAFDTCDHPILLNLLRKKGIQDTELEWFKSYLTNRKQFVSIGGVDSNLSLIKLGVPQGSILGPLLFLIYINDLPDSTNLPVFLFADDTVILASDPDPTTLIEKLNSGFKSVCTYFRNFKLSLNPVKTQYIVFSNSQMVHEMETHVYINNNNDNLPTNDNIFEIQRIKLTDKVPAYKYLGVYFDPTLTFKYHIQQIISKLNRALYLLRSVKNFLPKESLKLLYYSLFHCHLNYACEIWSSTSDSLINQIFKKQKNAIRIISNSKYNAHSSPLFRREGILPLNLLIQYNKSNFMQGIVQGRAPSILNNIWLTNMQNRQLTNTYDRELRNDSEFYIPLARTNQISRFPLISLPQLWNSLPPDLTIVRNTAEFKNKTFNYFLESIPEIFNCTRLFCPACN